MPNILLDAAAHRRWRLHSGAAQPDLTPDGRASHRPTDGGGANNYRGAPIVSRITAAALDVGHGTPRRRWRSTCGQRIQIWAHTTEG